MMESIKAEKSKQIPHKNVSEIPPSNKINHDKTSH